MGEGGLTLLNDAKVGIILGSLVSGLVGYMLLRIFLPKEASDLEIE